MSARDSVSLPISELRFLVVEDHGFQRWAVANILQDMGAREVLCAEDGASALHILRTAHPDIDIVITDLDMPEMDGMQFIRHIASSGITASLVVASALDLQLIVSVEAMARAYGLELLGSIRKPVTPRKLAELIACHQPGRGQAPTLSASPTLGPEQIAQAVARDEFEAYFQPKIDLETGAVKGAEALARWRHPHGVVLGPGSFLPTLEKSADMDAFTEMMLTKAVAGCAAWREARLPGTVAVNISSGSLADLSLADRMVDIVAAAGLAAGDVVLEITETAAVSHLGRVLETLSRLRMKGFGLSIDDYGMGYSSMQQLTHISFTELKIDQAFVRNAAAQRSSLAVLESSLEMARKLDIVSIAEGVERDSELQMLVKLGCRQAQGFLFAAPMPIGNYLHWLQGRSA
jgi:EAL domain-containing protein (putative c-di-GMP-specific phosphodiesterase class I)